MSCPSEAVFSAPPMSSSLTNLEIVFPRANMSFPLSTWPGWPSPMSCPSEAVFSAPPMSSSPPPPSPWRLLLLRPGSQHKLFYLALVGPPSNLEKPSFTPLLSPAVSNQPVAVSSILAPSNDPDCMISSNHSTGKVCFLVDSTGVHEEVGVDLHHSLHWTLCPDLMHNVLFPPARLSCACHPSDSVGWLHLHLLSRARRPRRTHLHLADCGTVRHAPFWPGPMMSKESPSPVYMATLATSLRCSVTG